MACHGLTTVSSRKCRSPSVSSCSCRSLGVGPSRSAPRPPRRCLALNRRSSVASWSFSPPPPLSEACPAAAQARLPGRSPSDSTWRAAASSCSRPAASVPSVCATNVDERAACPSATYNVQHTTPTTCLPPVPYGRSCALPGAPQYTAKATERWTRWRPAAPALASHARPSATCPARACLQRNAVIRPRCIRRMANQTYASCR